QGMIRLIVPSSDTLAHLACDRVERESLSESEWTRFVGATLSYQDTCATLAERAGVPGGPPRGQVGDLPPRRTMDGTRRRRRYARFPPPRPGRPRMNAPGCLPAPIATLKQPEGATP